MNITVTPHDRYTTIGPEGELDANSSVYLDETIRSLIEKNVYNLHINMENVTYISSAGLGVFISFIDEIEQNNGKIILTHLADNVHEVFTILGLDKIDNLKLHQGEIDPSLEF
ncbi:MAG: STAS domain-containing protein [Bacteroidota bacterium]